MKTPAKDAGSDIAGPRRKALVTEKSQASWPPPGPQRIQTSAGRRKTRGGIRRIWVGRAVVIYRIPRDKDSWFLQDRPKTSPIVGSSMYHVPNEVVTGDPMPHPQTRAWSPHLSMICGQRVQFVSWDHIGMRRRRLARNGGARIRDSSESGRAKSHAPAPGIRLRQN